MTSVIWPSDMSDEPSDKTIYLAGTLFLTSTYKPAVGKVYLVYIHVYADHGFERFCGQIDRVKSETTVLRTLFGRWRVIIR